MKFRCIQCPASSRMFTYDAIYEGVDLSPSQYRLKDNLGHDRVIPKGAMNFVVDGDVPLYAIFEVLPC